MIDPPAPPFVWSDVKPGELTFRWNPPTVNCSALHYIVNSTGCGNCTDGFRTTSTSITCSVHAIATGRPSCRFAVRSVICSNISSSLSNQVDVLLKGMPNINSTLLFKIHQYIQFQNPQKLPK